ncbi:alpha/beta fold hydrolase [Streptomyces sp. MUM 178J]|nr:alpha/beta fold hydrolase [Streptomyces sp. MUM 178J]WRQ78870.1 alpha/beta fold hydrolase [Streptomyces sp. MUM 178J]
MTPIGVSHPRRHGRQPDRSLLLDRAAAPPKAAVLLLHGGCADSLEPPPAWNLPGVRMRPFGRAVARATTDHDVVLGRVRYRCRGWNGDRADAARDALQALEELAFLAGPVPVVLVGHSMGGRAALRAAGHPAVEAVVGLAPWCPDGEPVEHLAGRRIVLVHGDRDRVTDPRGSWDLAARARAAGAETCALRIPGGDHAMLRHAWVWHTLTTRLVTGLLRLGPLPATVADSFDDLGPGDVRRPVRRR